jgi:predicted metal-dependent HD superfamily phosphohydrolase
VPDHTRAAEDAPEGGRAPRREDEIAAAVTEAVQTWSVAVAALGGDRDAARRSGDALVQRYAEPHRRYHTLEHVRAVLACAADLAAEVGLDADQQAILTLAVCAHDVVYDAKPGADEQASADWARAALLEAGAPGDVVERIAELVLGTATHEVDAADRVAAVLSDADLAILAAPRPTYDAYARAVRQEFDQVPDAGWRSGREAVLRALAQRPRLYVTDEAHRRWDAAARANLARERAQLRRQPTS